VQDPSGTIGTVEPIRVAGRTIIDLGRPIVPGTYAVESATRQEAVAAAAVNVPPQEALLQFADERRAAASVATMVDKEVVEIADPSIAIGTLVARQRQRAEIWPWLVGAAILAAAAEMLVAARIARQSA
jgi:hypothetical protein